MSHGGVAMSVGARRGAALVVVLMLGAVGAAVTSGVAGAQDNAPSVRTNSSVLLFVNHLPDHLVDFQLYEGQTLIVRLGVHPGGSTAFPITTTTKPWTVLAIAGSVKAPSVTVRKPNATITAVPNSSGRGFTLSVT
jgi:hypothetical protein